MSFYTPKGLSVEKKKKMSNPNRLGMSSDAMFKEAYVNGFMKSATTAAHQLTRNKLREKSIYDKILTPTDISNKELNKNMNEEILNNAVKLGFIKAAQYNGLTEGQAIDLLKIAGLFTDAGNYAGKGLDDTSNWLAGPEGVIPNAVNKLPGLDGLLSGNRISGLKKQLEAGQVKNYSNLQNGSADLKKQLAAVQQQLSSGVTGMNTEGNVDGTGIPPATASPAQPDPSFLSKYGPGMGAGALGAGGIGALLYYLHKSEEDKKKSQHPAAAMI